MFVAVPMCALGLEHRNLPRPGSGTCPSSGQSLGTQKIERSKVKDTQICIIYCIFV